jgi:hypothetical protein
VLTVVLGFVLDGRHVADHGVEAVLVEPVHPVQGAQFQVVDAAPGSFVLDEFAFVEPDQGFGFGVVPCRQLLPIPRVVSGLSG